MTFSIVGRCARTGQFGIAISSSSPAVAAHCSHVRAGVGAVSNQNITDPDLGPLVLDALQQAQSAASAVEQVMRDYSYKDYRQVLAVDGSGQTFMHSGGHVLGVWSQSPTTSIGPMWTFALIGPISPWTIWPVLGMFMGHKPMLMLKGPCDRGQRPVLA